MSRTYFINTLDIDDLEENSNKFCKCLEALTKLKSGDKLTVSEIKSEKNDTVLLSPACASFDLFENFEDRGNKFKKIVNKELIEGSIK